VHLRSRCHNVKEFDAWLEGPVFRADARADERRQLRHAALMRGEIPA
jgi:hypothetical protein